MAEINQNLRRFFYDEADEHLAIMEQGLLQLEQNPHAEQSQIEQLFRSSHTIKGASALVKLNIISGMSHRLEDIFEGIRSGLFAITSQHIDAMLFTLDQIHQQLERVKRGDEEDVDALKEVERRLTQAEDSASHVPLEKGEHFTESPDIDRTWQQNKPPQESSILRVSTNKVEDIMNILGDITVTKTHLLNHLHIVEKMQEEIDNSGQRLIREVNRFSERYAYALPELSQQQKEETSDFYELEFDRYDEINLFAKSLAEITNDINEAMRSTNSFFSQFTVDVEHLDRQIVDIREQVSEIRTISAEELFQRFRRSARDLSQESGKPVELHISGGETLLDRTVYDGLFEPLLHIIRNSVAHGFESAALREELGKPAACNIWLSASRRGNIVDINVRDDGRGLQFERIRKRALEVGFLKPSDEPTKHDLTNMIFRPGFSTNVETDSTSGRGVGMNVVMDRLAALNGTINIETEPGQGTTTRLSLPMSLVIINVVQFHISSQPFVIPSTLVEEIMFVPGDLDKQTLTFRDEELPMVNLATTYGLPSDGSAPPYAIITQASGVRVALLVDQILSQEDTVIRPFGFLLADMPHFAGTSISGDGTLRLVLNPARILDISAAEKPVAPVLPFAHQKQTTVLLVDDSLSVRKFATLILETHNIKVLSAADGFQALEVLDEADVDLIITDLEMPHMDGYELIAELNRRQITNETPVAILSSRSGDRHREKAFSMGVSDYLVKPFEEESLMQLVNTYARNLF